MLLGGYVLNCLLALGLNFPISSKAYEILKALFLFAGIMQMVGHNVSETFDYKMDSYEGVVVPK